MKFERQYVDDLGTIEIWYFDTTKYTSGPYKIDIQYTKRAIDDFKLARTKKKRTT
jgi:hypothetical protein